MPRKTISKLLPKPEVIKQNKYLKVFGDILHNANLWHLNRRSASGAIAVGIFCAFMPIPFQMLLAAALAILFRVNLPLSVSTVWLSNPLTMGPIFYMCYRLGSGMLGLDPEPFHFQLSFEWLMQTINSVGTPLILGCVVGGLIFAGLGYLAMRIIWRYAIGKRWTSRCHRYRTMGKMHAKAAMVRTAAVKGVNQRS